MKRILSVVLALVMMLSVLTVGAVQVAAEETADTKLYFEVPESWGAVTTKNSVFAYIWNPVTGDVLTAWKAKAAKCTIVNEYLVSYDVDVKLAGKILDGETYGLIFVNTGNIQSFDAYFTRECLGDTAYIDESVEFVNCVDSTKRANPLYFKNSTAGGPVRGITNMGVVQGTEYLPGQTDVDLFAAFMAEDELGASNYKNALELSDYTTPETLIPYVKSQLDPSVTYADLAPYLPEGFVVPEDPDDTLYGDSDGDGMVTIKDVTQIRKYLVKNADVEMTEDQLKAADVTEDGKVNIVDALLIQKRLVHGYYD